MNTLNEKLDRYRGIIEKVLNDVAQITQSTDDIEGKTLFDRRADNYAVIEEGWDKAGRVQQVLIHLEIINGKVWIQADNTDLVIARDLERAGIPKSDIVLGFHPPDVRPFTEYSAA